MKGWSPRPINICPEHWALFLRKLKEAGLDGYMAKTEKDLAKKDQVTTTTTRIEDWDPAVQLYQYMHHLHHAAMDSGISPVQCAVCTFDDINTIAFAVATMEMFVADRRNQPCQ